MRVDALLYIPQARIIVDKFHVVRLANKGLDIVRKTLRGELSAKRRRVLVKDRFISELGVARLPKRRVDRGTTTSL